MIPTYTLPQTAGVIIGFERLMYRANESDVTVEVAVVVRDGIVSRPVMVRVYTEDGLAKSKLDAPFDVNKSCIFLLLSI